MKHTLVLWIFWGIITVFAMAAIGWQYASNEKLQWEAIHQLQEQVK